LKRFIHETWYQKEDALVKAMGSATWG